jgi:hypothetical protein
MSSVSAGLRPMKTWRMNGSQDLAVSPSEELSVGTVRQPRNGLALGLDDLLEALLERRRTVGLRGRKTMPRRIRRAGR